MHFPCTSRNRCAALAVLRLGTEVLSQQTLLLQMTLQMTRTPRLVFQVTVMVQVAEGRKAMRGLRDR